jgi:hypothetical protein
MESAISIESSYPLEHIMDMGQRNAKHTSEFSLRQFAVVNAIPDIGQQSKLRLLEGQPGVSPYFRMK